MICLAYKQFSGGEFMTITLVIADEMDLAAEGIKVVLRQYHDLQIVGTYSLLSDLLDELSALKPDVILLSDRLEPEMDPLTLVARVQQVAPRTRILVMSLVSDGLIVHELFTSGVAGYLYKNDSLSLYLITAIQTVLRGRPYLSPTANADYLIAIQTGRANWQLDTEAREILQLLAQGRRPQEIALQEHIPVRRVYNVCERLRRRFGAETNEKLMVRAAEEGFIS
jgi:DNA-binding NarL/FixJ family response regulator